MVKIIPFGLFVSSFFIDIMTLVFIAPILAFNWLFIPKKKIPEQIIKKYSDIGIIIPAYNEENNIARALFTAFNQTIKPKKVIVMDDCSTDNTYDICKKLQKKYKNLKVIRRKVNSGKAANVKYAIKLINQKVTIVLDSDTFLAKNYVEEITKPFANKRVVIVTGMSLPLKQPNFFGKVIHYGSIFQYKFFSFRKKAQEFRNAISVITGDSAAYRTSFLKEQGGLPEGTQTEDMDLTWIALEEGYRIAFNLKAQSRFKDANTLKGHWMQVTRWYAGGFQCLIKHNKKLIKAKPLLFTTLLPAYIDSFIYTVAFLIAPFLLFIIPKIVISFFLADLLLTLIGLAIVDRGNILHLPSVYFIKFFWSAAWIYAAAKTSTEYLAGRRTWIGRWARDNYYKKVKK